MRLWELRCQYAGKRIVELQAQEMQTLLEKGAFDMPTYNVTVSLPRPTDAIQTLTIYGLNEQDARNRTRRILHELGWVLTGETNIISVEPVKASGDRCAHGLPKHSCKDENTGNVPKVTNK